MVEWGSAQLYSVLTPLRLLRSRDRRYTSLLAGQRCAIQCFVHDLVTEPVESSACPVLTRLHDPINEPVDFTHGEILKKPMPANMKLCVEFHDVVEILVATSGTGLWNQMMTGSLATRLVAPLTHCTSSDSFHRPRS